MTVTAAELLDKAAEVLERDGWCRHSFHALDGSHCTVGGFATAIAELTGSSNRYYEDPTYRAARDTLQDLVGPGPLVVWNDEKALDGADVVNHLRKAAEIARSS